LLFSNFTGDIVFAPTVHFKWISLSEPELSQFEQSGRSMPAGQGQNLGQLLFWPLYAAGCHD